MWIWENGMEMLRRSNKKDEELKITGVRQNNSRNDQIYGKGRNKFTIIFNKAWKEETISLRNRNESACTQERRQSKL